MNFHLKKATTILCLATTLAVPAVLDAEVLAQPIEPSRFSFADAFRSQPCRGPERLAAFCDQMLLVAEPTEPAAETPDLRVALRLTTRQAPPAGEIPPEIRQIQAEESEYSRKRTAALSKMGTGTVLGSLSIAAAAGLMALGWDKNKEEEERGIPDSERESGYYFVGGLLVGVGGGGWGFGLRRKGKNELDALEAQEISFGVDGKGNPRVAYVLSLP